MFLLWLQCMCFFICYNLQIIQLHKTHLSLSPCDYSACVPVKALNSKSSSYKTHIWVFLCVIAVHVFLKFLLIPSYKATQNTITFILWSQCMWFFSCYNLQIIQLHKTHWSSLCLWQGVSYSDDFSLAVTTKFCTSNSSSKILKLNTKKILTLQAFQPCITLWVLN